MPLLDRFAPVAPNEYAVVPNQQQKLLLYTTSLASCLGLVILKPRTFAAMAHVVSADAITYGDYFDYLLADVVQACDGLAGLQVRVAFGEQAKESSNAAYQRICQIFAESDVRKTKGAGASLQFNVVTGAVLNIDPPIVTREVRQAVAIASVRSYDYRQLTNVTALGGQGGNIADAFQDLTVAVQLGVSEQKTNNNKVRKLSL